jgi:hypothetical protein
MLWTWLPYRKAVSVGFHYVAGSCELPSLQQAIQTSIDSIERVSLDPDESLAALRRWREMAAQAASGEITESQLAEWIVYQNAGLPPPLESQA